MSSKIIWLAVLFTLVYWLGSAGGCATGGQDQNYEVLEEDRPMFETQHDPDKPGASAEPAEPQRMQPADGPSLNGLDRSHWARVETGWVDAAIAYQPHYFTDLPLDATPPQDSPLDGAHMVAWNPTNTKAAVAQPVKVGIDLVLLPVRMVQDPPRPGAVRFVSGWRSTKPKHAEDAAETEETSTEQSDDATMPEAEPVPADEAS